MWRYVLRRVPSAVIVLIITSIAVFGLLRLAPGDPAAVAAGPDASPEAIAQVRHNLGLDDSLVSQYWHWITGLFTGNLGNSYTRGLPISQLIGDGAGNTIELALAAIILAVVLGLLAGLALGVSNNRVTRGVMTGLTALFFAIPPYVSGVLFVLLFAVTVRFLPAGGHYSFLADPEIGVQFLILPAVTLALPAAAIIARFLATSIRQVLDEEYIRTGTAKGLRRRRIVLAHALPNALPPVLTVLSIQIGQMLGGAIVVEAIFAWPGLGQLIVQSVQSSDYVVVEDLLLLAVAVFIVLQLVTDLVQAVIDPRLTLENAS